MNFKLLSHNNNLHNNKQMFNFPSLQKIMIVRITISVVFVLALSSSLLFQYHNIYGQILNDKTLLDTQKTKKQIVV